MTRRDLLAALLIRAPDPPAPFEASARPTIEDERDGTITLRLTFLDGTALYVIGDSDLPWIKYLTQRTGSRLLLSSR